MITAQALANTILMKAFTFDVKVTPMKLQKLMYFIYRDYLKATRQPLFEEDFLTWKYGPVLSSIYYEFNSFKAQPITRFAKDAQGKVFCASDDDAQLLQSIEIVWKKYKDYSGVELSQITHEPGSAWYKAYMSNNNTLKDEDILKDETS